MAEYTLTIKETTLRDGKATSVNLETKLTEEDAFERLLACAFPLITDAKRAQTPRIRPPQRLIEDHPATQPATQKIPREHFQRRTIDNPSEAKRRPTQNPSPNVHLVPWLVLRVLLLYNMGQVLVLWVPLPSSPSQTPPALPRQLSELQHHGQYTTRPQRKTNH
jgi:hypothetical protein